MFALLIDAEFEKERSSIFRYFKRYKITGCIPDLLMISLVSTKIGRVTWQGLHNNIGVELKV